MVDFGSAMAYLANTADPGVGQAWIEEDFDDSAWPAGSYGVGYDSSSAAQDLIPTTVGSAVFSVYTRATFAIADRTQVANLYLGVDFDDGYVAWINGVEVHRSASMPPGPTAWNTSASEHESSNDSAPIYEQVDISVTGIPALHDGTNTLAIGVWNTGPSSSDLVLAPHSDDQQGVERHAWSLLAAGNFG